MMTTRNIVKFFKISKHKLKSLGLKPISSTADNVIGHPENLWDESEVKERLSQLVIKKENEETKMRKNKMTGFLSERQVSILTNIRKEKVKTIFTPVFTTGSKRIHRFYNEDSVNDYLNGEMKTCSSELEKTPVEKEISKPAIEDKWVFPEFESLILNLIQPTLNQIYKTITDGISENKYSFEVFITGQLRDRIMKILNEKGYRNISKTENGLRIEL